MTAPLPFPLPAHGGRPDSFADALQTAVSQAEFSVPHGLIPWRADVWHGFTDGSATPCPGQMSIGGYLVSPQGRITGRFAEAVGFGPSLKAEFLAVRRLLERARAAGIRALIIHTDNEGLSKACRNGFTDHQVQLLHPSFARMRKGFARLEFAWLPRGQNTLADWLSRAALRPAGGTIMDPVVMDVPDTRADTPSPCCPAAVDATALWTGAPCPPWPLFPMTPTSAAHIGARTIKRLPQKKPVDPIAVTDGLSALERAASRRERHAARLLAGPEPGAYPDTLLQVLREAAGSESFDRFIRQRLALRKAEQQRARAAFQTPPARRHASLFRLEPPHDWKSWDSMSCHGIPKLHRRAF